MSSSEDDDFRPAMDDEEEEADAIDDAIVDEVVGEDAVTIVDNSPSISSKVKVKATKKKTPPKKAKKAKPRAPARPATASAVTGALAKKVYLSSDSEDNAPVYRHQRPASASSSAEHAAAGVTAARSLLTDSNTDAVLQSSDFAVTAASVAADDESASDEEAAPVTVDQMWAQLKTTDDTADKPLDAAALRAAAAGVVEPGANKVVITETFDYAGEAVQVTRTVDADSLKRKNTGLEDVVGGLRKKKLSAMSKSHIDWESFKDQEGLQDELRLAVNAGGHLDKEDFLQRTDLRQFANERDVREVERQRRVQQRPSGQ